MGVLIVSLGGALLGQTPIQAVTIAQDTLQRSGPPATTPMPKPTTTGGEQSKEPTEPGKSVAKPNQSIRDSALQSTKMEKLNQSRPVQVVFEVRSTEEDSAASRDGDTLPPAAPAISGTFLGQPDGEPALRTRERGDWSFYLLVFMTALMALIRNVHPRVFSRLNQSVSNIQMLRREIRDENLMFRRGTVFYLLLYIMGISYLVHRLIQDISDAPHWAGPGGYLLIITGVGLLYGLKYLALQIMSQVFKADGPVKGYIFTSISTLGVLGALLVPVLWFYEYSHTLSSAALWLALGFTFFALMVRYIRTLQYFQLQFHIPIFYTLLYFCTLEIGPFLLIWKWIQ